MSGNCSLRPVTATSWFSTISAACRPGCRIPSACRLASGSAFSTRRLFTDQDEILFAAARQVILNGIEDIVTRPDLADRAILLMLAPIAERQSRSELAFWREFELARPHILGAVLDAVAHGLRTLPRVRLKRLPRMADFALWATACASDKRKSQPRRYRSA
jgi:hypothetical protein